jgi:uncharacterized repeat protein (TIGR04138 family)
MEDLGSLLLRLQEESGIRAEALDTVLTLVRRLSLQHGIGGVGVHLEAAQVSNSFFGTCRERFGPLTREVLSDWGIPSPEFLGDALSVLADAGLLAWGEDDGPENYDELPELPDTWPHPLDLPSFRETARWEPFR